MYEAYKDNKKRNTQLSVLKEETSNQWELVGRSLLSYMKNAWNYYGKEISMKFPNF